MKAIYFERREQGSSPDYCCGSNSCGSNIKGLYVPELEVILSDYMDQTSNEERTSIVDSDYLLEEADSVLVKGESPKNKKVTYFGKKELEYDDCRLRGVISDARCERKFRQKVESDIEALFCEAQ